jgi:hypothetical protein
MEGLAERWLSRRAALEPALTASSVAPVLVQYVGSLRPCIANSIAPRRRAPSRQALLEIRLVAVFAHHDREQDEQRHGRADAERFQGHAAAERHG